MTEELRRFASDGRLAGILTFPARERARPVRAVIFVTAGLVHKPGPHRLYVQLARSLAASGFMSLRFDLSGIGESAHSHNGEDAEASAVQDVREAMDYVAEESGASEFVLIGLCSGAEVAHRTALADGRVHGLVCMDGYILRNWKYYVHHYLPRLLSPSKWLDFAGRRLARLRGDSDSAPQDDEQEALAFWTAPPPSRERLEEEFQTLARRGVRQLQILSGGSGACSYERQFRDVFHDVDFGDTLSVSFMRHADHMYVLSGDRRRLITTITRWMCRNFATAGATRAASAIGPRVRATHPGVTRGIPGTATGSPAGLAGRRHYE